MALSVGCFSPDGASDIAQASPAPLSRFIHGQIQLICLHLKYSIVDRRTTDWRKAYSVGVVGRVVCSRSRTGSRAGCAVLIQDESIPIGNFRVSMGPERPWNSPFDFSGPEKSWIKTYVLKSHEKVMKLQNVVLKEQAIDEVICLWCNLCKVEELRCCFSIYDGHRQFNILRFCCKRYWNRTWLFLWFIALITPEKVLKFASVIWVP